MEIDNDLSMTFQNTTTKESPTVKDDAFPGSSNIKHVPIYNSYWNSFLLSC